MKTKLLAVALGVALFAGPVWSQTSQWVVSSLSVSNGSTLTLGGAGDVALVTGAFTRNFHIQSSSATSGVTAPAAITTGTNRSLCFDADAEESFFVFEVPSDWDGVSDMQLMVEWFPETTIADTLTVIWSTQYRSIADGQSITAGTVVTSTVTYTQSGAGTATEAITSTITIDYDNVNQPLTAGDHLFFQFDRDVTGDTYLADGCVHEWMIVYQSTGFMTGGA